MEDSHRNRSAVNAMRVEIWSEYTRIHKAGASQPASHGGSRKRKRAREGEAERETESVSVRVCDKQKERGTAH